MGSGVEGSWKAFRWVQGLGGLGVKGLLQFWLGFLSLSSFVRKVYGRLGLPVQK